MMLGVEAKVVMVMLSCLSAGTENQGGKGL